MANPSRTQFNDLPPEMKEYILTFALGGFRAQRTDTDNDPTVSKEINELREEASKSKWFVLAKTVADQLREYAGEAAFQALTKEESKLALSPLRNEFVKGYPGIRWSFLLTNYDIVSKILTREKWDVIKLNSAKSPFDKLIASVIWVKIADINGVYNAADVSRVLLNKMKDDANGVNEIVNNLYKLLDISEASWDGVQKLMLVAKFKDLYNNVF